MISAENPKQDFSPKKKWFKESFKGISSHYADVTSSKKLEK